ncbi:MAG TPA: GNAT family N-acetyltransferase [Acidimicrobiales bacterium]|nr:GNAT family N-acetyltransferase [Acidimicrobiales bacterium]
MAPTIRVAIGDDSTAVLALWARADAEPSATDDADGIARLLAHDAGALLLAERDGEVVGSIIAGWDGWRGSIYRLAVDPRCRRQGVARVLLAAAQARLDALGTRRSQAIVVEGSASARAFWAASGWQQQTERLRFVSPPED